MKRITVLLILLMLLCGCSPEPVPPQLPEDDSHLHLQQEDTYFSREEIIARNESRPADLDDIVAWAEEYILHAYPGAVWKNDLSLQNGFAAPDSLFTDSTLQGFAITYEMEITPRNEETFFLPVQVLAVFEGQTMYLSGLLWEDAVLQTRPEAYDYLRQDSRFADRMQALPEITLPEEGRVISTNYEVELWEGEDHRARNALWGSLYAVEEEGSLYIEDGSTGQRTLVAQGVRVPEGGDITANEDCRFFGVVDDHRFVYHKVDWEWAVGVWVYDVETGESLSVTAPGDLYDGRHPLAIAGGRLFTMQDHNERLAVTDLETMETHCIASDLFRYENGEVYDLIIAPDGSAVAAAIRPAAAPDSMEIFVLDTAGDRLFTWTFPNGAGYLERLIFSDEGQFCAVIHQYETDTNWFYFLFQL